MFKIFKAQEHFDFAKWGIFGKLCVIIFSCS